jgi:3'-phosphoadenosine 5'-phosphosulfate (PAPS) 3'-phosphatase
MEPKDWDLAAPKLILEEAGGVLRDAYGNEIELGKISRNHHGLIATKNLAILEQVSDWYHSRK